MIQYSARGKVNNFISSDAIILHEEKSTMICIMVQFSTRKSQHCSVFQCLRFAVTMPEESSTVFWLKTHLFCWWKSQQNGLTIQLCCSRKSQQCEDRHSMISITLQKANSMSFKTDHNLCGLWGDYTSTHWSEVPAECSVITKQTIVWMPGL